MRNDKKVRNEEEKSLWKWQVLGKKISATETAGGGVLVRSPPCSIRVQLIL